MNEITNRLKKIQEATRPEVLASEGYKTFKPVTPIDTGNARRSTSVQGDTIHANYAYATRLNNGYSKQARDGMVTPTIAAVQRYIDKL